MVVSVSFQKAPQLSSAISTPSTYSTNTSTTSKVIDIHVWGRFPMFVGIFLLHQVSAWSWSDQRTVRDIASQSLDIWKKSAVTHGDFMWGHFFHTNHFLIKKLKLWAQFRLWWWCHQRKMWAVEIRKAWMFAQKLVIMSSQETFHMMGEDEIAIYVRRGALTGK